MNTIDCIKTRRSVRKFKNEQIKDEELIQVLEAGTWSPTSMGAQHPHIIAVQNPAFLNRDLANRIITRYSNNEL